MECVEILGDLTNLCISTLSLWKKIQLSLDEMAQFISFQALVEEEEYTSGGEEEYNSEGDNSPLTILLNLKINQLLIINSTMLHETKNVL